MSDLLVRTVDSDCYIKTSKAGPFHSNGEPCSVISKQVSLNRCPRRTDNSVRLFEKDVTEWLPFPTRNSALSCPTRNEELLSVRTLDSACYSERSKAKPFLPSELRTLHWHVQKAKSESFLIPTDIFTLLP